MQIDVDHFKAVNDSFGHEAGDFLLAEISALLRDGVGLEDIPARFGGDELCVIVRDAQDAGIICHDRQPRAQYSTAGAAANRGAHDRSGARDRLYP